jgi:hypothetical protein
MRDNGVAGSQVDHQAILEAIPGSYGIIQNIRAKTGFDWAAIRGAIDHNPILKKAWDSECEDTIDRVENKMHEMIKGGEAGLTKWYLTCKARNRGYAEKIELQASVQVLEVQSVTKSEGAGIGKAD